MLTILKQWNKRDDEKNCFITDTLEANETLGITKFYFNKKEILEKTHYKNDFEIIEIQSKLNCINNEYNHFVDNTIYEYKSYRINKYILGNTKNYYIENIK